MAWWGWPALWGFFWAFSAFIFSSGFQRAGYCENEAAFCGVVMGFFLTLIVSAVVHG